MKKSMKVIDDGNKRIIITLLVMTILIAFSCAVSVKISKMEEQACWDTLHASAREVSVEIESRVNSDQRLLDSIADIIAAQDSIDSPEIKKIIAGFRPNTMISHIALLLPGDQLILPGETPRNTGGLLSFEEEAALGCHISDRSVDIRDRSRMILRNFVPIKKDNEIIAMLYGVVDLQTLPEDLYTTAYDGKAAIYVMDGKSGNFIVDTWHDSLGNLDELGTREVKEGYSRGKLRQDISEGNAGYCVFTSQSTGENLYFCYEPTKINGWSAGISVSEDLVFAKVNKANGILLRFISLEILLLAVYFVYILRSTKKEVREKQYLAERDLLTGVLNRNSFESRIDSYAANCRSALACIYIDVNGLHELNNTKGHAAGDEMLKMVADALQSHFKGRDVYRIGGDEFVVFVRDTEMDIINGKLKDISKHLAEHGFHISAGICRQKVPVDIGGLFKQAEKLMYDDKKRYYDQKGVDRRRRP